MHCRLLYRTKVVEELLDVRVGYAVVQVTDDEAGGSRSSTDGTPLRSVVHIVLPSAVHIALEVGVVLGRR